MCAQAYVCAGLLDPRPDTRIPRILSLQRRVAVCMPRDIPEQERRAFHMFIAERVGCSYEGTPVVRTLFARHIGCLWGEHLNAIQWRPSALDGSRAFHVMIDALRDA